ncbi:MAG: NAD-binding protein [Desulfovibrionaceae bacterium]|nr:NAD-binding protein [Desulfovibrionaceae bacterium]
MGAVRQAMSILVCGVGRVGREVLRRLGEGFVVSLIDTSEAKVQTAASLYPNVARALVGDAASPVLLEEAGLADQAFVLALTHSDKVNLAIAREAVAKDADRVLALVHDSANLRPFQELGVHTVTGSGLLAQDIYHYIEDPRMRITPLASGPGAVFEFKASDHFRAVGKRPAFFGEKGLRLAAIFRRGELVFPGPRTVVRPDDRLVLLGEPDSFQPVCELLECGSAHFPLAYGPGLLLGLPDAPGPAEALLSEGLYLSRNTKVKKVTVLAPQGAGKVEQGLDDWPEPAGIEIERVRDVRGRMRELCGRGLFGLAVIPGPRPPLFRYLAAPVVVRLAHDLDCPLLISRLSFPYEQILVPFNATASSELALEVAVDLAGQLGSRIRVAVVEEPVFISDEDKGFAARARERLKELGHIHRTGFEQLGAVGNPVREILALAEGHDLVVVGSSSRDRGLFSPNRGEHLARRARCSVLVVTS